MTLGLVVLIWLTTIAVVAWPVMLLLGAVHASYVVVPAFSYWATYALILAFRIANLSFGLEIAA